MKAKAKAKAKTPKLVLSPVLLTGIHRTWDAIGYDVASSCLEGDEPLTNEVAVESVLDADRMLHYHPEAHKELKALFEVYNWDQVCQAVRKAVKFV